jgi:hypothetical protein
MPNTLIPQATSAKSPFDKDHLKSDLKGRSVRSGARRLIRFGHYNIAKEHFATALKMHHGGGLNGAYSRIGYCLAKILGPVRAEIILVPFKRALAIITG